MLKIDNYTSQILKKITFSLESMENLIILGSNGAGKSTLAKVLSNIIENKEVSFLNENISLIDNKKRAQLINYIPPKLEIFDEYLTVYEFLELSFIENIDKSKIDKIITLVGIEDIKNRSCQNLSSGEKQLLLLASSMIHNAKITIFDELTANMDISRIKEVFNLFNSDYLQQKIIITHNLDLAYHLKYKILYLKEGQMEFFGTANEFFKQDNLDKFYKNSLEVINGHLVVKL